MVTRSTVFPAILHVRWRSAPFAWEFPCLLALRQELDLLATADVVLDCMLGTGFHGKVRAPFDIWIECLESVLFCVLSVDVPSVAPLRRRAR